MAKKHPRLTLIEKRDRSIVRQFKTSTDLIVYLWGRNVAQYCLLLDFERVIPVHARLNELQLEVDKEMLSGFVPRLRQYRCRSKQHVFEALATPDVCPVCRKENGGDCGGVWLHTFDELPGARKNP